MSKKTVISLKTSHALAVDPAWTQQAKPEKQKSEKESENLYQFRKNILKLKEEVSRLSFMMSEIHSVLETSSFMNEARPLHKLL